VRRENREAIKRDIAGLDAYMRMIAIIVALLAFAGCAVQAEQDDVGAQSQALTHHHSYVMLPQVGSSPISYPGYSSFAGWYEMTCNPGCQMNTESFGTAVNNFSRNDFIAAVQSGWVAFPFPGPADLLCFASNPRNITVTFHYEMDTGPGFPVHLSARLTDSWEALVQTGNHNIGLETVEGDFHGQVNYAFPQNPRTLTGWTTFDLGCGVGNRVSGWYGFGIDNCSFGHCATMSGLSATVDFDADN
jgi:hypothetical protein